mmetsp:Transcript_988/g.2422  ORF Transcript_988/g.2422 Transcript_988/m.2422 type:complete len:255 (-) Transcript_988:888-1652(-)
MQSHLHHLHRCLLLPQWAISTLHLRGGYVTRTAEVRALLLWNHTTLVRLSMTPSKRCLRQPLHIGVSTFSMRISRLKKRIPLVGRPGAISEGDVITMQTMALLVLIQRTSPRRPQHSEYRLLWGRPGEVFGSKATTTSITKLLMFPQETTMHRRPRRFGKRLPSGHPGEVSVIGTELDLLAHWYIRHAVIQQRMEHFHQQQRQVTTNSIIPHRPGVPFHHPGGGAPLEKALVAVTRAVGLSPRGIWERQQGAYR